MSPAKGLTVSFVSDFHAEGAPDIILSCLAVLTRAFLLLQPNPFHFFCWGQLSGNTGHQPRQTGAPYQLLPLSPPLKFGTGGQQGGKRLKKPNIFWHLKEIQYVWKANSGSWDWGACSVVVSALELSLQWLSLSQVFCGW